MLLKVLPGAGPNGQYTIVLGDCVLFPVGDCSQHPLLNLEVFVLQKVYVSAPLLAPILYELYVFVFVFVFVSVCVTQ